MERIAIPLTDSAWLRMESARAPMHVGVMLRYSLPDDAPATYLGDLVERWRSNRSFAPPFNYRLTGSVIPKWDLLDDDEIDIDYHFRHSALPAPGGERELGVLVSRLHTSTLNRQHPLWELHVIEGLEGNEWAMYAKVHHSQFDGMAGIRLFRRSMSVNPDDRDMLPVWAIGTKGPDQSGTEPRTKAVAERPGRSLTGAAASSRAVLGAVARTYTETVTGAGSETTAVPFRAPHSILNKRVNSPRRFATQHYSLDRLRAVARAADSSINDVFLAICGAALRRYLSELGELPDSDLTATVPVAMAGADGTGNAISFMFCYLGVLTDDPVERLHLIQASMREAKQRMPEVGRTAMDAYTTAVMAPSISQTLLGVAGRIRPQSNVVISNVPGAAETRYFDGSRLESFYPVSLILDGQALNITGLSYAGTFGIGYTGCRDNVPHLQHIAVYSGEALDELEKSYDITPGG